MMDIKEAKDLLAGAEVIHSGGGCSKPCGERNHRKTGRHQSAFVVCNERWRAFCRAVDDAIEFSS